MRSVCVERSTKHGNVVKTPARSRGHIREALALSEEWLGTVGSDYEQELETLERMANLLEGGELAAMATHRLRRYWRLREEETLRTRAELGRLLVAWEQILAPCCEGEV
jgi:hypothetical protein